MKKWIWLGVITVTFLVIGAFFSSQLHIHPSFNLMVLFFAIQTMVLFRIDQWVSDEWKVQASLVKIVVRLLTSLVFITVLILTQEDRINMGIQFILIYLTYMIFEIVEALTNLRRN